MDILTVSQDTAVKIQRQSAVLVNDPVGAVCVFLQLPKLCVTAVELILLHIGSIGRAGGVRIQHLVAVHRNNGVIAVTVCVADLPHLVFGAAQCIPKVDIGTVVQGDTGYIQHVILIQAACNKVGILPYCAGNRRFRQNRWDFHSDRIHLIVSCQVSGIDMGRIRAVFKVVRGETDIKCRLISGNSGFCPQDIVLIPDHCPGGHDHTPDAHIVRNRTGNRVAQGGHIRDLHIGNDRFFRVRRNIHDPTGIGQRGVGAAALIDTKDIDHLPAALAGIENHIKAVVAACVGESSGDVTTVLICCDHISVNIGITGAAADVNVGSQRRQKRIFIHGPATNPDLARTFSSHAVNLTNGILAGIILIGRNTVAIQPGIGQRVALQKHTAALVDLTILTGGVTLDSVDIAVRNATDDANMRSHRAAGRSKVDNIAGIGDVGTTAAGSVLEPALISEPIDTIGTVGVIVNNIGRNASLICAP